MQTMEEELSSWLRIKRSDQGFDIRQLSIESNVPIAQISRIENQKSKITVGTLVRLAYGLDVDLPEILRQIHRPLFYIGLRNSREIETNLPIPTMNDIRAFYKFYRDEAQSAKKFLQEGYYQAYKLKGASQKIDKQELAELVRLATYAGSDERVPLLYPHDLNQDHLLDVYASGGVANLFDLSTLLRIERKAKAFTLRDLSDAVGISHAAIARLENGEVERMIFEQILDLDKFLVLEGALVGFAWEIGEYQSGISMNKFFNEHSKKKVYPTKWDPFEKAFGDALITICRWYQVYGSESQSWWKEVQREISFYKE